MARKSRSNPKVYITSKGVVYVDANELFRSPKVQKFIDDMAEIEKKSKASQKSPESKQSTS